MSTLVICYMLLTFRLFVILSIRTLKQQKKQKHESKIFPLEKTLRSIFVDSSLVSRSNLDSRVISRHQIGRTGVEKKAGRITAATRSAINSQ